MQLEVHETIILSFLSCACVTFNLFGGARLLKYVGTVIGWLKAPAPYSPLTPTAKTYVSQASKSLIVAVRFVVRSLNSTKTKIHLIIKIKIK